MADLYGLNGPLADDWRRLEDDAPAPAGERLLVGLERLRREGEMLRRKSAALAVSVEPDIDVETLADELPALAMVELRFPGFADGRAFSQARELRERFGYDGDIRAAGEVLRDQLSFMRRCGFNQFDLSREPAIPPPAASAEIRYAYQPADQAVVGDDARRREGDEARRFRV